MSPGAQDSNNNESGIPTAACNLGKKGKAHKTGNKIIFKTGKGITVKPEEQDYILYLDHLHSLGRKSSTLWSTYSRLNCKHKMKYGEDLDKWPRIKRLLTNWHAGYKPKQASAFTKEQIHLAMNLPLHDPEWTMRKAVMAIYFCGGLRSVELRSLTYGSVSADQEGYWIRFTQAKARGPAVTKEFLVPWNREREDLCFASRVKKYLTLLNESLASLKEDDALFHRASANGYVTQAVGEKSFATISKEVAKILDVKTPGTYTSHGYRAASATECADNGATSYDMMRMFGWTVSVPVANVANKEV